jgi:hypothetical protein
MSTPVTKETYPLCALRVFVFQKTPWSRAEELETKSHREHGEKPAPAEYFNQFQHLVAVDW